MIDGSQSFFDLQEMMLWYSKNKQGIGTEAGCRSRILIEPSTVFV